MKFLIVLLVNILLIFLFHEFTTEVRKFSVDSAVTLQQTFGPTPLAIGISEVFGPEPRVLTIFLIAYFSTTAEQLRQLLFYRFFAHYTRWLLGIIFQEPRPSWISNEILMLHCPASFGIPSGHAFISLSVMFPILLHFYRSKTKTQFSISVSIFLIWYVIMFLGRVYLGTHSPQDLFFGTVFAISTVLIFEDGKVWNYVENLIREQSIVLLGLIFIFSLLASKQIATILSLQGEPILIRKWDEKMTANNCRIPQLFSYMEAVAALFGFAGLVLAINLNKMEMVSSVTKRVLIAGGFCLFKIMEVYVGIHFLEPIVYFLASFLMFTSSSNTAVTETTEGEKLKETKEVIKPYGSVNIDA